MHDQTLERRHVDGIVPALYIGRWKGRSFMSVILLQAARDEERRLINELRTDPVYQKLELVRLLIAAYEAAPGSIPASISAHATTQAPRAAGRVSSREGSKASSHIAEAQAFLREKGTRAQTREIMEALKARGVVFDSEKPVAALASTLSHSALFDNVRGEGYGLVEWDGGDGRVGLVEMLNRPEFQQATEALTQAFKRNVEVREDLKRQPSADYDNQINAEVP